MLKFMLDTSGPCGANRGAGAAPMYGLAYIVYPLFLLF